MYTTQKKFRISCDYFFVLLTSNYCRLWKDLRIKLKVLEDISYIKISNFCEKQLIPNDETLIVQKPIFLQKNTKSCEFYVSTMSPSPVFKIVSEFIKLYSFIPSQKSVVMVNWLFNVITINDISVIYVTAHRCAGGLKKLDLRSGSQRHRHFVYRARPSTYTGPTFLLG